MKELDALLKAADAADAVLKRYYRQPLDIRIKPDGSPVTQADQESEKAVLDVLQSRFPEYGALGEETGQTGDQTRRFIIDPLDGTKSFIHRLPFCGPLLAFEKDGILQAGVVSLPLLGERVWAARGKGCFWNGKNCQVSTAKTLRESFLTAEWTRSGKEGYGKAMMALSQAVGHERGYSDAFGYFLVASGLSDGFVEGYPHYWDVAAPTVCIEEAGGRISHLPGKINGLSVASNAAIHDELCRFLNNGYEKT